MLKLVSPLALCFFLLPTVAQATPQLLQEDIFVPQYSGASAIDHFRRDGTLVQTIGGAGDSWKGVAIAPSGLLITTDRAGPDSFHFYDHAGGLLSTGSLGGFQLLSGDLDVLSTGKILVVNQILDRVEVYKNSGLYQGSWTAPGMDHPFGCYVDRQDFTWITALGSGSGGGDLYRFNRLGMHIQTIHLNFTPGDMVVAPDGSLWVTQRNLAKVAHLDSSGLLIGEFTPGVSTPFDAIGLFQDGTFAVAGEGDTTFKIVDSSGLLLNEYSLSGVGAPIFLRIASSGSVGTTYCFGDGSGAACPCNNFSSNAGGCLNSTGVGGRLGGIGAASISENRFHLYALDLPLFQFGLLFVGPNSVASGAGAPLSDGLRCVGGSIQRLGALPVNGYGGATWGPLLPVSQGWLAGDVRRFQVWYRDINGSVCGAGANLTNAVELAFVP